MAAASRTKPGTSTSAGTAIVGISETATRPTPASSGIRAVRTTWSSTIASAPTAATRTKLRPSAASTGATPTRTSSAAPASRSGTRANVAGVGMMPSSVVPSP